MGCGALSVPRKNFGLPETAARRMASRSDGSLATGLQKLMGSPAQSSMVRERWCGVMVAAMVGPHDETAEMAAEVVICSRIIRRDFGGFSLCGCVEVAGMKD